MTRRRVRVTAETWPLVRPFRISRGESTETQVIVIELDAGDHTGRGECCPSPRYRQSIDSVLAQIDAIAPELAAGLSREALQAALPSGPARNAIDCALWDLEAKQTGCAVWELAKLRPMHSLTTTYTLSIDAPEAMGEAARLQAKRPSFKLKMAGDGEDLARVRAVREAVGAATIVVDANEAWSIEDYRDLVPALSRLRVAMIEQPFPAEQDEVLALLARPIPVCADESCHTLADLHALAGRYDMINIKLDKTGGLTHALALRAAAIEADTAIMIGCMIGTSLAMAPAMVLAQNAHIVDIDGPLLLARDRQPGLTFHGSVVHPPSVRLWG